MFFIINSVWSNKSLFMFVNYFGFVKVYPLNIKGDSHMDLYQYFKDVGVTTSLHMDNAKDMDVRKK